MDVRFDLINGVSSSREANKRISSSNDPQNIRYDLINGASWSRGSNKRICNFKRTPKIPNFFLLKFFIDVCYDLSDGMSWSRGAN
ncbi:hypothetical protein H5410_059167 [Solanum commersonii]|uniref:Uncharacterized protein n=1 Tax=Solanum commersonii TaxID=4109 RepID=A0A9J5W1W5_SOLCO|nr:hypothetical protein H5410_059167 [Solanum commersonii]